MSWEAQAMPKPAVQREGNSAALHFGTFTRLPTVCMLYIVLKYALVDRLVGLPLSSYRCYPKGRFILGENKAELTAAFSSALFWRLLQSLD